jgi:hypothetical protein
MNSRIKETLYLNGVAIRAMGIPEDGFSIENSEIDRNFLLRQDTFVPVLVAIANTLGETLLTTKASSFNCIYPIELVKAEESLCFAKIVECDCEFSAPKILRILFTMEAINGVFIPRKDNKYDLTEIVRVWREVLAPLKEGQKIDLKKFHNKLILDNIKIFSNDIKNNLNNKF